MTDKYIEPGDKVKIIWRGEEYTIGVIQHVGPMYAIIVEETLLYINPNSSDLNYIELLEKANDR